MTGTGWAQEAADVEAETSAEASDAVEEQPVEKGCPPTAPAHEVAAAVLALHDLELLDVARYGKGPWLKGGQAHVMYRVHDDGEHVVVKIEISEKAEKKIWKLTRKATDEEIKEGSMDDFSAMFASVKEEVLTAKPANVSDAVFALAEPWLASRTAEHVIVEWGVLDAEDDSPLLVLDASGVTGGALLGE